MEVWLVIWSCRVKHSWLKGLYRWVWKGLSLFPGWWVNVNFQFPCYQIRSVMSTFVTPMWCVCVYRYLLLSTLLIIPMALWALKMLVLSSPMQLWCWTLTCTHHTSADTCPLISGSKWTEVSSLYAVLICLCLYTLIHVWLCVFVCVCVHAHKLFVCIDILLGNNSGEDYPEEFLLQIYERIQKVCEVYVA